VITNRGGDILFLQRNGKARADERSNWDLPGGLVENGEDDVIALGREVEEELKRKAKVGQELGKWAFFRPFDGNTVEVTNYAVTLDEDGGDLTLSEEHLDVKFVPRTELPELDVKDSSILDAHGAS
jgi:8-oxo-dGTP pyrophosphatase MutT (NUDIX family)